MIPTRNTPDVLSRARALTTPVLRRAVNRLSPELRPVVEYHFGWSDEHGNPTGGDGGKGIRPALALLSAEAVGAPVALGVLGGVAVELVHNFSLIHDDVIDEDRTRRHRATVWALFGIGRAVIVGDALLALAQQIVLDPDGLVDLDGPLLGGAAAARSVADATAAMIAGQALDMAFEAVPSVDVAGCLAMEAGKTGALLGCASSIGAVLAGAQSATIADLERYGIELGLAFQAVDDLLGIWGDAAQTGKPAFSDIRQHKKTLPISAALASGADGVEELAALLARSDLTESDLRRAAALVDSCGGRAVAIDEADRRLGVALGALETAGLTETGRDELREVARFVVERDF